MTQSSPVLPLKIRGSRFLVISGRFQWRRFSPVIVLPGGCSVIRVRLGVCSCNVSPHRAPTCRVSTVDKTTRYTDRGISQSVPFSNSLSPLYCIVVTILSAIFASISDVPSVSLEIKFVIEPAYGKVS